MNRAPSPSPPLWEQIVGEELSGVTFVRDHLQFQFNPPPILNALTKTVVTTPSGSAALGDAEFANMAIGLIGSVVETVRVKPDEAFVIGFVGGSSIAISLREMDAVGPEAVVFYGRDHQIEVI